MNKIEEIYYVGQGDRRLDSTGIIHLVISEKWFPCLLGTAHCDRIAIILEPDSKYKTTEIVAIKQFKNLDGEHSPSKKVVKQYNELLPYKALAYVAENLI